MAYRLDSPNIVEIHGKKYYNSLTPCRKYGHIGLHYLNGMCAECLKIRGKEIHKKHYQKSNKFLIQKTPEYLHKKNIEEIEYKKKWYENNKKRIAREAKRNRKNHIKKPYLEMIWRAKKRAFRKGWEYDLTKEWAEKRWTGKCELTKLEFKYFDNDDIGYFYSASIDRIDSKKGYTQDNCRFILYALNIMKGKAKDEDIFVLAKALVEAQKL